MFVITSLKYIGQILDFVAKLEYLYNEASNGWATEIYIGQIYLGEEERMAPIDIMSVKSSQDHVL